MRTMTRAVLCLCALAPLTANANLLSNGGFEDATGAFPQTTVNSNNPATFDFWIDRVNWNSVVGATSGAPAGWSGNNFARQNPLLGNPTDPNATDLLMQAIDASAFSPGTALNLVFDYYRILGSTAQVVVYGMLAGSTIDPFAPFFNGAGINDCVTCVQIYSANLATTANWTSSSHSFLVGGSYEALIIGFIFGGNLTTQPTYANGIDNVRLTVPEPMTLALFGAGLLGVGLARRRRHHA